MVDESIQLHSTKMLITLHYFWAVSGLAPIPVPWSIKWVCSLSSGPQVCGQTLCCQVSVVRMSAAREALLNLCAGAIPAGKRPPVSLLGGVVLFAHSQAHCGTVCKVLHAFWKSLTRLHSRKALVPSHFKAGVAEAEMGGTARFARTLG